jgi:predicted transcriptional regulator
MSSTLTLRLPERLNAELARMGKKRGISKSDVAREALERYLNVQRFQESRAALVPEAESRGIYTDEDVFERLVAEE